MMSASLILLLLPSVATAHEGPANCAHHSLVSLKRMTPHELEALYAQAAPGPLPVGRARGHVLILTGKHCPCLAARLANLGWKGKTFAADGCFVNQWLGGVRAIESQARLGPSLYDGQPAIVMEYAPGTPLLGNIRDEIRAVAPGLYLGLLHERCPCPRFLGYFVVEAACVHGTSTATLAK
jgi:hypothetical protein